MDKAELVIDPAISRKKFERELVEYRKLENVYLERGWFLLKAEFPQVFVVFATPKTSPSAIVLGVVIDFENYDYWPPSVTFVNPFTRKPYLAKELSALGIRMPRLKAGMVLPPGFQAGLPPGLQIPFDDLLQDISPDTPPFICVPGIREYHNSPVHSGDSWLLHRGRGEGTLNFILETVYNYAVQSVTGLQVQQLFKIQFQQGSIAP